AFARKITRAQSAPDGSPFARGLDVLEIDVIAEPPGQAQRILTDDPPPAQRSIQFQLAAAGQICALCRWSRHLLDLRSRSREKEPCQQPGSPGEFYAPEFQQAKTREDGTCGDPQGQIETMRNMDSNRRRREDPGGNED